MSLQKDIDSIVEWSDKLISVEFNVEKCKIMHIGHEINTQYIMKDTDSVLSLSTTNEERDLGVIISSHLKSSSQCQKAANKAMSILGMVKRNFKRLWIRTVSSLFIKDNNY